MSRAPDDTRGAPIACVRLPALALQLATQSVGDARAPVAVVEDERPDTKLALVNAAARTVRIVPGMRRNTAQSLMPELRVHVVTTHDVREAERAIVTLLHDLTPRVEPDAARRGVLYVDPSGFARTGGVTGFTARVGRVLEDRRYRAVIAVAFDRHTAFVIASSANRGVFVARSPEHAWARAARVPLARLDLSPELGRALDRLGLRTVGELLALPADAVHARLGEEASRLAHALHEAAHLPLQPLAFEAPITCAFDLEPPEADSERLLFVSRRRFAELLREAGDRGVAVVALRIALALDHGPTLETRIEPASPTRDVALLTDLFRLRLASMTLVAGVAHMRIDAELTQRSGEQLALFRPKRDVKAASRALARVRAAFGEDAVVRACLRDAHLPEARFRFTPSIELQAAKLAPRHAEGPLIRRLHGAPLLLPEDARLDLARLPYRIQGGWWARTVERHYGYVETEDGALRFVYFDPVRGRFYVHGEVD